MEKIADLADFAMQSEQHSVLLSLGTYNLTVQLIKKGMFFDIKIRKSSNHDIYLDIS